MILLSKKLNTIHQKQPYKKNPQMMSCHFADSVFQEAYI